MCSLLQAPFYSYRVRVAGPPQCSLGSHAVADWLWCQPLVSWCVWGASPAPVWREATGHGGAGSKGWDDPFHLFEISLPETYQRQMLQPQVIYQGTLGSSCKKKGASLKGNC